MQMEVKRKKCNFVSKTCKLSQHALMHLPTVEMMLGKSFSDLGPTGPSVLVRRSLMATLFRDPMKSFFVCKYPKPVKDKTKRSDKEL